MDERVTRGRPCDGVKRIGDVSRLRMAQFPQDAGPMAHPIRPESYIKMDNFYTVTVYEKGAEAGGFVRTTHSLLVYYSLDLRVEALHRGVRGAC